MTHLQVRLFGDPSIEQADGPVRFASRAAMSLFAYLILGGPRRVPRSVLTGVFWPDFPEAKARRRLSHALWQISSALGESAEVITAQRDTVEVNGTGLWVDVWEFDSLVDELGDTAGADHFVRLGDAAALVRGELGEGVYDDWVIAPRERCRERHGQVLNELVRAYKARSELDAALATARRVVELNPLAEERHREVMRLLHLLGRTAEAIDQYDRLQLLLDEELGAAPEAETDELLDRLVTQGSDPIGQRPPEPELVNPAARSNMVGRDTERAHLRHGLDDALAGAGGVVLIEGEAGIGKSHLLRDLAESAEWRGFDVATVACRALGAPYAALADALEQAIPRLRALQLAETLERIWLQELAAMVPLVHTWLPDLGTAESLGPAENQSRRNEAAVQALVAASAIRPLLLIVENLHEADGETLAVVRGLARAASGRELLVAIGYRPTEAREHADTWHTLVEIEPEVRQRLTLAPLDEAAISELAFNAGVEVSAAVLQTILLETGGNPLFALETLRAVDEHHDGGIVLPVGQTVHDVISSRLALVAPTARAALESVAVLGRPASLDELALVSDHESLGALSADVEELLRRSMLIESDDDFALPHEQVRHVV